MTQPTATQPPTQQNNVVIVIQIALLTNGQVITNCDWSKDKLMILKLLAISQQTVIDHKLPEQQPSILAATADQLPPAPTRSRR